MANEIREKHFLAYASEEKEAINMDGRRIRFVISSDQVDRDGEIVETDAIVKSIPAFSKNPVCLSCHQHRLPDGMPPVVGSWDTNSFKASAHKSEMDLMFATTDIGETWWNLYSNRHVRAVSIGFRCLDGWEEVKDKVRVFHITKIEMYEISVVPVPAQPAALSVMKGLGLCLDDATKDVPNSVVIFFAEMEKRITENLKEQLEDQFDRLKLMLIDKNDPDGCGDPLAGEGSIPPVAANTGKIFKALDNLIGK